MKFQSRIVKLVLAAAVLVAVTFLTAPAAQAYHQNPMRKFGRGVCNTAFGVADEVPRQVHRVNMEEGPAAAVTYGLVKGLTYGIGRTLTGIFEIITFPIPNGGGRGYDPIFEPEFPFRDFNDY